MAQDPWEAAAEAYKTDNPNGSTTATAAPAPDNEDWKIWQQTSSAPEASSMWPQKIAGVAKDLGIGTFLGGASSGQRFLNALASRGSFFNSDPQIDTTPKNTAQSIGKDAEQAAEFLIPSGIEDAVAENFPKMVGPLTRFARPLARLGTAALGSGAVNAMQGGGFGTGAAAGAAGSLFGAGMKKIAPRLAETAMGVQGLDRAYGRTPGEAILEDTKGLKPITVRRTAQNTVNRLQPQVDTLARNSQNPAELAPVLGTLDSKIAAAGKENSPSTVSDLQNVRDHFTTAKTPGALPYVLPPGATQTSAEGALHLKRGLAKEFINRWSPEKGTDLERAARGAYGQTAEAFHAAAPEVKELDQRISSLMPIIDRAGMASRRPGVIQGVLDRFGRPTGGLAPLIGGAYAGSHAYGFPGALIGGAAGAVTPHIAASPTVQMFGARTLASPALSRGLIPLATGAALQATRPEVSTGNTPNDLTDEQFKQVMAAPESQRTALYQELLRQNQAPNQAPAQPKSGGLFQRYVTQNGGRKTQPR